MRAITCSTTGNTQAIRNELTPLQHGAIGPHGDRRWHNE
jgi:hypothetical protein